MVIDYGLYCASSNLIRNRHISRFVGLDHYVLDIVHEEHYNHLYEGDMCMISSEAETPSSTTLGDHNPIRPLLDDSPQQPIPAAHETTSHFQRQPNKPKIQKRKEKQKARAHTSTATWPLPQPTSQTKECDPGVREAK